MVKLSTLLVTQKARIADLKAIIREEFLVHVTELEAARGKAAETEQTQFALEEQFRLVWHILTVLDSEGLPEGPDIMGIAACIQRRLLQLEPTQSLSRARDNQAVAIITTASAIPDRNAHTIFLKCQHLEAYK
jgi:hypothetical protein